MTNLREDNTLYDRIRSVFSRKFGAKVTDKEIAEHLGVSNHLIGKWKIGRSRPTYETLEKIQSLTGVFIDYLVTGYLYDVTNGKLNRDTYHYYPVYNNQQPIEEDSVPPNATRPREPVNFVLEAQGLPVVGKAAADETQGTRAGFFPLDPETHFEQVTIPETTSAVEILGDSMSPVLLDGQYALLGPEYSGPYSQPKNYEIVVADVEVRDSEQAGSDTRWEGVYCKRIVDAGDVWIFLSINYTGTPFSAAKVNCRVWPVIGVWFGGKGETPIED